MDLWPYRVAEAFLERYVSTDLLLLVCFKRVCVSRIDCVTPLSTAELCVVADVLDCIHKHEIVWLLTPLVAKTGIYHKEHFAIFITFIFRG